MSKDVIVTLRKLDTGKYRVVKVTGDLSAPAVLALGTVANQFALVQQARSDLFSLAVALNDLAYAMGRVLDLFDTPEDVADGQQKP